VKKLLAAFRVSTITKEKAMGGNSIADLSERELEILCLSLLVYPIKK